ncbi:MAG: hypothetical protein KDJ38_02305 [Gammaproteobacteria bacterium]|nr:hypothetical protein [Gammaproteobacteria bacterium]
MAKQIHHHPSNEQQSLGVRDAVASIAYWLFMITLFFGIKTWLGEELIANLIDSLFGGYIALWQKYATPNLPSWDNPFMLIFSGAILLGLLNNFWTLSRTFAAFIAALLIFKIALWQLGSDDAVSPSLRLYIVGGLCISWLIVSSFLPQTKPLQWLVYSYRRLSS